MENNTPVPYIAYESTMARMERANKRSFIIIIILIIALIATNAGWVIYESQFETVETSTQIEVTTRTKTRQRKTGGNSGYRKCNMCHGTGRIKEKKPR